MDGRLFGFDAVCLKNGEDVGQGSGRSADFWEDGRCDEGRDEGRGDGSVRVGVGGLVNSSMLICPFSFPRRGGAIVGKSCHP